MEFWLLLQDPHPPDGRINESLMRPYYREPPPFPRHTDNCDFANIPDDTAAGKKKKKARNASLKSGAVFVFVLRLFHPSRYCTKFALHLSQMQFLSHLGGFDECEGCIHLEGWASCSSRMLLVCQQSCRWQPDPSLCRMHADSAHTPSVSTSAMPEI